MSIEKNYILKDGLGSKKWVIKKQKERKKRGQAQPSIDQSPAQY